MIFLGQKGGKGMEELHVSQQLGIISTNLDTIAEELKEQMSEYKDYVVTQETIASDKKVLADLRKLKKSMEDARKSVKSEWEKPYKDFESRYKEVLALVEEPINMIDAQLKLFEEDRAAAKKEYVKKLYEENIGELERFLPFDTIFNPKWTNASTKDQDILFELSEKKLRVETDLEAINALDSEIYDEVIEAYIRSGNNLASAIQRNNQYIADKNRTVEQIKESVKEEEAEKKTDAMTSFNDMIELVKTVKFIVSKSDEEDVENLLKLSGIQFSKVEEG